MVFRKAEACDAEEIFALYRSVLGMPFCTWNEFYPGRLELETDLAAGTLFLLKQDNTILGAISIVPENELNDLPCWRARENAREFARVVIAPEHQGKGLSRFLVEGIEQELQKRNCSAIHISVAKKNIPAQRLYRGMGFEFCAEAEMYGNSFFLCEKLL